MERQTRPRDISLSIHSFTITASPAGSYGLKVSGKAPAMVAQVQRGSTADRAGLKIGDFVLRVAGGDTRRADGEFVLRRLKEEAGKPVEVGVARPSPVPVTDKEKMRALIVLQTKLDNGTVFQPSGNTYSNAVQGALAATQNILGDLGLDEEVEVKMYDSDSLPSPPPSSDSEEENDPLLDFTREDAFSYTPGKPVKKDTQSLAESVRQATQALESIKGLTQNLKKKERSKSPVVVTSAASLQTTEASSSRRQRRSPSPNLLKENDREQETSPTPFDDNLQWVEPTVTDPPPPLPQPLVLQTDRAPPPVPPHARTRESGDTRKGVQREDVRRETEKEDIKSKIVPKRQAPRQAPKSQSTSHGRSPDHVPLRIKKSKDLPAGVENESKVIGKVSGYKKLHPPPSHPAPSPPADKPVTDLTDQQTALKDLPPSIVTWRGEEVSIWLFQLSPTLSQHYRPCFSRHDITGQTLMRLNLAKLKSMGIDNIKHCQQLALEIAKLKIYQESLELKELEEENQISFL